MTHYTSTDQGAFVERITFDFIGQIAQRLEASKTSQTELAAKVGVTDSEVSQVLNLNRVNLNLKTMVKYARALGMKLAVVAYDDDDPANENGPVGSDIFNLSWQKIGKPKDIWSIKDVTSANDAQNRILFVVPDWKSGFANYTSSADTSGNLPVRMQTVIEGLTHARS